MSSLVLQAVFARLKAMRRRQFIAHAAALGATAAWCGRISAASISGWREHREAYPEGVASGDPDAHSVLLWTRRPYPSGGSAPLSVEVAEDATFRRIVASSSTRVSAETDWTCRVLVGGLKPGSEYFYRFTDAQGFGSRIGRTLTAPRATDPATVRFAFVSCQNINYGAQNAWRRMIFDDARAAPDESSNAPASKTARNNVVTSSVRSMRHPIS